MEIQNKILNFPFERRKENVHLEEKPMTPNLYHIDFVRKFSGTVVLRT